MSIDSNLLGLLSNKDKFIEEIIRLTRDKQIIWKRIYRYVEQTEYKCLIDDLVLIFQSEHTGCHFASINNYTLSVLRNGQEIFSDTLKCESSDIEGNKEYGNIKIGILAKLIFVNY